MEYLGLLKTVSDIGLFAALCWLAYKISGGQISQGAIAHTHELNDGLKNLIREADDASRSLNDQLMRRQESLERLLNEITSTENRVNRAISAAENPLPITEAPRRVRSQPVSEAQSFSEPVISREIEKEQPLPLMRQRRNSYQEAVVDEFIPNSILKAEFESSVEPPSFEEVVAEPVSRRAPEVLSKPLHMQVEREVYQSFEPEPVVEDRVNASLSRIQENAEKISVQGRAVQRHLMASAALQVTAEEHSSDHNREVTHNEDPRLGVLTAIKRQVQTL